MKLGDILLIITIVLLAVAQIVQKMASRRFVDAAGAGAALLLLFRSVEFWLSGLLLATALITWLCTLTVLELSKAYPLLSVSYALAALLSHVFLDEQVGRNRWLGIGLISAGATIMLAAQ